MLTLMLFIVCIGVNAEKKYLTFSCAEYCAAQWNSETNTLTWGSGGWNSAWTFMAADGISGDLSEWQSLHLNAKEFTNSQKEVLTVVFKKNDGSNPPSGPTKEFVVAPDANGDITIDLTTVEWGDCDITNIQDLTIYGGARTDANQNASVVVTDAYFEKADAAPIATVVTFDIAANPWNHALGSTDAAEAGNITEPLVIDGVTLSFDQATAGTPARFWSGPQIRVYKDSKMKIAAPEGKAITKIEFTASDFGLAATPEGLTSKVWEGNSTNVEFIPSKTNKITKIVVTITDKNDETVDPKPVELVSIANTAETAYTIAEAIALIDDANSNLSETVFVKGIVSKVGEFNATYKSITYWISADGTEDGQQFQCYSGKGLEGADFASADDIKVGATVIVKGIMKKHDTAYEFNYNNELVSYVAPVEPYKPITLEKLVKKTSMVDEFTTIEDLTNNKFMLQHAEDGLLLCALDAVGNYWDINAPSLNTAIANAKNGAFYKLVAVDSHYQMEMYNVSGDRRGFWAGDAYVNAQPTGNVIFGLAGTAPKYGQDGQDLALWDVTYTENLGFAFKCVGRDIYLSEDGAEARPSTDIFYWKAYKGYNAVYDKTEAAAAYEAVIAAIKTSETKTALETAKNAYDTDNDVNAFGDAINAAIDIINECAAINTKYSNLDATGAPVAAEVLAKYNNGEFANVAELIAAYYAAVKAQTTPGADFTGIIVNPSFELGNTNGWTSNNGGAAANNGNFHQATGSFFVEKWTNSANGGKLSDGSLTQVIAGLPAGKYKLTAEMQNLEQGNGDAAGKGFYLIANTDSMAVAVSGETVAVETELEKDADLTIGAVIKGCTGNWVCVDNFQLTLVELAPATIDEDPELVAPEGWTSAIANGNLATDNVESFFSKEAGKDTNPVASTITAGAGKNESRGIAVSSQDKVKDAWESQFFIKFNEEMPVGTKVHVQFDCKADKAATIGTQAHAAPGSYKGNNAIGQVAFTAEWATFTKDFDVTDEGMQSIAFNLNDLAAANTYYFDNFGVWVQKPAPVEDWVDIVVNGNMEGDDASCFYVSEQGVGGPYVAKFTENIGKDGSKAIKIQSADKPANAWDTQFFVRLPYQLPAGTKYKISFDIKADAAAKSSTQIHTEPGGWKGNAFGDVNFTTEWQSFEKEGNVAADMQTFVFNLAELATANVYVFDNVKVEISEAVKNTLTLNPATNPVAYPSEAVLAAREDLKAAIAEAEAIDTTDKLGVEELTAAITEAKKHTSANTLEEIETAKADLATAIAAFNEANKPVVTHTWDFTKWSEATVANLKADAAASKVAGWSDVEKKADAEAGADPTEASKDNCFWAVIPEGGELTANGVAIEELKGLQFGATFAGNRSLAIAVNYAVADASKDFGPYNGPAYLWLGGAGFECFTIPAVKGGTKITMGVESHKITDARGVQLFAGETELKDAEGNAVAAPTTYTEQTWAVPAGVAYDIVVKNTKGCHIYFIDAEQDEATLTSISTVKSNVMNNAIYNLNGQKVNKAHKGLFIINGKKVVK